MFLRFTLTICLFFAAIGIFTPAHLFAQTTVTAQDELFLPAEERSEMVTEDVEGESTQSVVLEATPSATVTSVATEEAVPAQAEATPGDMPADTNGLSMFMIDPNALGFRIPTLGDLMTFGLRTLLAIAGLASLFFLLSGAFQWIISGGDKDALSAAREKMQAAVVGLIMMVVVLSIVWTLEQVIFKRRICLGLTCPLQVPAIINY